jgi:hypothetical protein
MVCFMVFNATLTLFYYKVLLNRGTGGDYEAGLAVFLYVICFDFCSHISLFF